MTEDWESRLAQAWMAFNESPGPEPAAVIEQLADELPADSGPAAFERACVFDSTGHSDLAVPRYRQALHLGLTGERRRRAVIQLSSSLRNLGEQQESIALLTAEMKQASDQLDDALRVVLALCLTDVGREREAVALLVTALAAHLPRYRMSMTNYARLLVEP